MKTIKNIATLNVIVAVVFIIVAIATDFSDIPTKIAIISTVSMCVFLGFLANDTLKEEKKKERECGYERKSSYPYLGM